MKKSILLMLAIICIINLCTCAESDFSPVGVWDCSFTTQYHDAAQQSDVNVEMPEDLQMIISFTEDGLMTIHYESNSLLLYATLVLGGDTVLPWELVDGKFIINETECEYTVTDTDEFTLKYGDETIFLRKFGSGSNFQFITFGRFEQDGNMKNGPEPIEWYIIDEEGDGIVLLSRYALSAMRYDEYSEEPAWDRSEIGQWLNTEFYETAFTSEEKEMLHGQNGSEWKVSLLSEERFSAANGDKSVYYVIPSEYAKQIFNASEEKARYAGAWLSTPVTASGSPWIFCVGEYGAKGIFDCDAVLYVRPVIIMD